MAPPIQIIGINGIPEVKKGDSVAQLIMEASKDMPLEIYPNDVFVVTQKIVSKSEGAFVDLRDITPSPFAEEIAAKYDKDSRHVEVVLQESSRIVRMDHGVIIAETKHGFICANAGVDASNIGDSEILCLLPKDPDASAKIIRSELMKSLGINVSVVITDTFGRPWRQGTTDVAIGVAGISPLKDYRGLVDPYGYPIRVSVSAVADEIASAAELIAGKIDMVPVVVIRGYEYDPTEEASARELIRDSSMDLFR